MPTSLGRQVRHAAGLPVGAAIKTARACPEVTTAVLSTGAAATASPHWTVDANAGLEHGPGAAGRFADVSVAWVPNDAFSFDLHGGAVDRPLELRYYDATSRWIGARAERLLGTQRRVWADVSLLDDRDRPDASKSSLGQIRLRSGVSLSFGSAADRMPLPPGHMPPR